jgi:hypothetical protein
VNPDGSYVFFIRLGSKPIEFEKGKNAVAVPSLDKIPLVIEILKTAVRNGELDDQLAKAKKPPPAARSAQAGGKISDEDPLVPLADDVSIARTLRRKRTAAAVTSAAFTEFPRQLPHRVHFLDNWCSWASNAMHFLDR